MTTAVIWSKDDCPYCVQAKALLKSKGIEFTEHNITTGPKTADNLKAAVPNARTLPQIFMDDVLVGGFGELKKKLAS